ncbi:alkane hydroxylase MAH1-like [Prosopis cineraria]|uniref:alkane hydroxylase MAH1-like n=1 Tax=Prosopis cineraria TaxID=364024 RepID=UPI0024102ACB|nr:alkane hydroxylase MAH1-like [Prosopis cineraria]
MVASFLVLVLFLYYYHRKRCCKDHPLVTEWPILGMLPPFLGDLCHFQDLLTHALQTQGGTANFHGPSFTEINSLMTCDPMNAHHIMSKNFGNYVKGPEYRRIFRAFGEGALVADLDSQPLDVDLQDVFNRFSFDTISSVLLERDPKCLAVDFPEIAWERALNESEEFLLYRYVVPRSVWKLQRWLGIGPEKKMVKTIETFDQFLLGSIASKREGIRQRKEMKKKEDDDHDLLMVGRL